MNNGWQLEFEDVRRDSSSYLLLFIMKCHCGEIVMNHALLEIFYHSRITRPELLPFVFRGYSRVTRCTMTYDGNFRRLSFAWDILEM